MADGSTQMAIASYGGISHEPMVVEAPTPYSTTAWYAVQTFSRCEKQIARLLQEREVECFLPLNEVVRQSKSGRKHTHLVLFPGYIFVHIALRNRLRVLQVPGVARLVSFNGQPAVLEDAEIEGIRRALTRGLRVEPYPYFKVGHEVEISTGSLQGLRGRILRKNNRCRVVLSVNLLHRSVVVDVDATDLTTCLVRTAA